jgi:hypothetical protein
MAKPAVAAFILESLKPALCAAKAAIHRVAFFFAA